jgi:hypothetical protein
LSQKKKKKKKRRQYSEVVFASIFAFSPTFSLKVSRSWAEDGGPDGQV